MTKRAFKLLTTVLLLAVSFNNSYSMNNNIMSTDEIIELSSQDEIIELLSQGNLKNNDIETIEKSFYNVIEPMINKIKENIMKNYKTELGYEIKPRIEFNPDFLRLSVDVHVRQDVKIVGKLGDVILLDNYNIIQQMANKLMTDNFNCFVEKENDKEYNLCITFNFRDTINEKCIDRILNNIKENKNFDTNVKEFFDKYIGNGYKQISNIFEIENQQILNNIKLILENGQVKDYIVNKLIKEEFEMEIDTNRKELFKGQNDPSKDKINPASRVEFIIKYRQCISGDLWHGSDCFDNKIDSVLNETFEKILEKNI